MVTESACHKPAGSSGIDAVVEGVESISCCRGTNTFRAGFCAAWFTTTFFVLPAVGFWLWHYFLINVICYF
jgi:hypothetical protein